MKELPNFKSLKRLYKNKVEVEGPEIKLAILGDFSTQLLNIAIQGMSQLLNINLKVFEADFGQIDLQVLNPESQLYSFQPDWVLILNSNSVVKQSFYKSEAKCNFATNYVAKQEQYFNIIQERCGSKCIISNLYLDKDDVFGNYAAKVETSFARQVQKINYLLSDFFEQNGNTFLLDMAGLCTEVGLEKALDSRMLVNASLPYDLEFIARMAFDSMKTVNNISGKFAKCLILDLDNTTWGGIIGDDGMENIQIGDLGLGKAFKALQSWAKQLKERGVILAVCSKNEEVLAKEPFEKHPDMVLRLEDIAVFVANWNTKVENIKHIQSILNIGFDSMVFLDDNPMERDIVRQHLPEVTVPELPSDPSEYMDYIKPLDLFSTVNYSALDKDRTSQYQAEAERVSLKDAFGSMQDYLSSLKMEATISPFDKFYTPRIAQLTQRSNQFNPRTQRYTEENVEQIIQSKEYLSRYILLKDKFGDYGLISNLVLRPINNTLFIENWVMSCRVLKRQVEEMIINDLVGLAKEHQFDKIIAEYIPTKKNILVKDLFTTLGFETTSENLFELEVNGYENKDHQITIK